MLQELEKAERCADDDVGADQRFERLDWQTTRAWSRSMEQKLSELGTSEEHRHLNGHELLAKIREKMTRYCISEPPLPISFNPNAFTGSVRQLLLEPRWSNVC